MAIFPVTKDFELFFSNYQGCQPSGKDLKESTKCSDKHCRSYKIISLGRKNLLETQFLEKKSNLSSEEKMLAYFVRLTVTTECDKADETIFKGPNGNPIFTLKFIRSFL